MMIYPAVIKKKNTLEKKEIVQNQKINQ